MNIQDIEKYLKDKNNMGIDVLGIRWFDGTEMFSNVIGDYKAKTLEESLELFFKEKGN